jgi:hypothetical protein
LALVVLAQLSQHLAGHLLLALLGLILFSLLLQQRVVDMALA